MRLGVWVRKWLGSDGRRRGPRGPGEQGFGAVEEPGPSRGPRVSLGSARCRAAPWRGVGEAGRGQWAQPGCPQGHPHPPTSGHLHREALPDRPAPPATFSVRLALSFRCPPTTWRLAVIPFPVSRLPLRGWRSQEGRAWAGCMTRWPLWALVLSPVKWACGDAPPHIRCPGTAESHVQVLGEPPSHTHQGSRGSSPPTPHPCFCQGSERGGDLPTATGRGSRQRGGGTPGTPPAGGGHAGASGQAQPPPEGRELPHHPSSPPAPACRGCTAAPCLSLRHPGHRPVPNPPAPLGTLFPQPFSQGACRGPSQAGAVPAPGLTRGTGGQLPRASGSPRGARALEAAPLPCPSPGGQRPNAAQHRASRGLASAAPCASTGVKTEAQLWAPVAQQRDAE